MNADEIGRILDELGQRLGPAGERVFSLVIRQQAIEGLFLLVMVVALVLIAATVSVVVHWRMNQHNLRYPDPEDSDHIGIGWRFFVHGTIWSFATVALAVAGTNAATKLLNPEYAALRSLIETVVR